MTASRRANVFCFSVSPAAPASSRAHPPRIRSLARRGRPARERRELALAEAVLGRPCAHHVPPRRGLDAVPLSRARVVRDRLAPAIADLDARRRQLALALLDLPTARGELAQHRRSDLLDLGHPVAHRPPAHPRQPLPHRGAQVRLVEEAGRLGVLVDRRRIKRRPATVRAARHVRRHHMGMQLRILGAAHPMAIRRRHEPLPHLAPHAAAATTHPTRLTLQIPQRRVDRRLVRLDQRPASADSPTANSTLTDLGAENVRSKAATFERPPTRLSRSPVPGSRPSISAMKPSSSTRPPSSSALRLRHRSSGPATHRGPSSSHRAPARPGARNSATARPSACRSTAPATPAYGAPSCETTVRRAPLTDMN